MKFSYNELLAALQGRVAEMGADYVFDSSDGCRYVIDNEPACIIGCALYDLGITSYELGAYDANGGAFADELPYWDDERTERLAVIAQGSQDMGRTWSRAVSIAEAASL